MLRLSLVLRGKGEVMARVWALLAMLLVLWAMRVGDFAAMPSVAAQDVTPVPTAHAVGDGRRVAQPAVMLPSNPAIQLVKVAGGLADPLIVASPPDDSGRLFVVERVGRVRIINKDGTLLPEPFLDLSTTPLTGVDAHFIEQGMLGLAFHPNYKANGRFYVAYTDYATNGDLLVVEFHVSGEDPNKAQSPVPYQLGEGGQVLLDIDQPYIDHNGGTLHFGPDGYLYIAIGDGGGRGDPFDQAQDRFSLFGKLLRLDVGGGLEERKGKRKGSERILPYGIPPDNPFAGGGRLDKPFVPPEPASDRAEVVVRPGGEAYRPPVRQEIWAFGLRNPWQFSFDPATGDLYIPDVGSRTWEEINFQLAGSPGGQNYGWDWMEGAHCYPEGPAECPQVDLVLPVAEYKHGHNGCAIVGIGVYRGEVFPALDGIYFSADWCSGKIWGLQRDEAGTWIYQELLDTELQVTGSGFDERGNLYVTACTCTNDRRYDPFDNPQGTVWRLVGGDQVPEGAETAPLQPEEGATPTSGEATRVQGSATAAR
jgi:glucose/arabinose dehydrogenase